MKQTIKHGAELLLVTTQEAQQIFAKRATTRRRYRRIRATATLVLDAAGNGQIEVYAVPFGCQFALRRVTIDSGVNDPNASNIGIGVAGKFVEYLRSGARIEYANAINPSGVSTARLPGVQTWGSEQGPTFINGEVFEVKFTGCIIAGATFEVIAEGILRSDK